MMFERMEGVFSARYDAELGEEDELVIIVDECREVCK